MKAKITKRTVESIKPGDRDVLLWDTVIRGFGVKVTPKGARVYIVQYWARGRSKRYTIGRHGTAYTADQARQEAARVKGDVADGGDPAALRAASRTAPTLATFRQRYLKEHAAVKKKASSAAGDKQNLTNHIVPALGHLKMTEINRADVTALHQAMRATPGAANRCLALLSKMFNLAEKWDIRPDGTNPTRHVEKYPERKIERFLSDAEMAQLGVTLVEAEAAGENPSVIGALRLLIFTGCRRDEILKLRWEHVDMDAGCLRLPDSKTGAKVVPLGAPALEVLTDLPRVEGNPYVLPGAVPGKHYVALEKAWRRLRAQATLRLWRDDPTIESIASDLENVLRRTPTVREVREAAERHDVTLPRGLFDVRLHDLRHSFASVAAAMGESLILIGSLLGHADTATTARYAHLSDDPKRAAADRIAGRLAAAMRASPDKVVVLQARART